MNFKTRILSVTFFAFSFIGLAQNNCKELKACERKLCELNTKLVAAKKANNQNQIKGVEDAIYKTQRNCTTKKVNNELDKNIKEKQQKVEQRKNNLQKAINDQQDKEKIEKKRKKLNEANAELNKALEDSKNNKVVQ